MSISLHISNSTKALTFNRVEALLIVQNVVHLKCTEYCTNLCFCKHELEQPIFKFKCPYKVSIANL